jgi:hypothetical protein
MISGKNNRTRKRVREMVATTKDQKASRVKGNFAAIINGMIK